MTDENTIRIYTADVTPLNDSILFDRIYDSVSPYRRNKTDEKKLMKDRILSLGVEFLLMTACRDAGIEYSEMIYGENGYGKLFFENCPLCFSLSHSGERAMCVTAPQPVGCDTERIRNVSPQVAARHFSLKENNLLETCVNTDERNDLFFRLWTLKESFVKCAGLGLTVPLSSFTLDPSLSVNRIVYGETDTVYSLFEESIEKDYRYAWCIADEPEKAEGFTVIRRMIEIK